MADRFRQDPARHILLRPFQTFFDLESASGLLLLASAVGALVWANSPWAPSYVQLWETHFVIGAGDLVLDKSLHHWINDGLMAVFFFVVGLEIKREVLVGELASPKKAALSVAAAAGGVLAPAGIYALLNAGGEGAAGWGIPMATDIAFALGVLALLGSRVPLALKVFVTAIAIVDDLIAVLVIAFFYTAGLNWAALGLAAVIVVFLVLLNRAGARSTIPYVILGVVLWIAFLKSGVHATVAGVVLALTIPARRRIDAPEFLRRAELIVAEFAEDVRPGRTEPTEDQRDALHSLEVAAEEVETPLIRLEHGLHPWVAYFVMPVFALANAGVALGGDVGAVLANPVALGIVLGLVLGKPIGILVVSWLAVRTGLASLPTGVGWRQISGVGLLCGIGFTMSLFIASLAFPDPALLDTSKIGILAASLVSGVAGALMLVRSGRAGDEETT
ncbi:MAG: Na+/H+ antiporter NhaA [Gemmatimonadota bacterium]|nr:Na+/H+ antiporter NhaA [Gemmatimonadota bacterium]